VNFGGDIPATAQAVHGVSTEQARERGVSTEDAVREIALMLAWVVKRGGPLTIMNAPFDWPLLRAEAGRVDVRLPGPVMLLDPLALDRGFQSKRPGKRTLTHLCVHYGVELEDAHTAGGDAYATEMLLSAMIESYPVLATKTLVELQEAQRRAHARWVADFNAYRERKRQEPIPTTDWPGDGR
jgi:DNA polymerase-3 subunit epsilon